MSNYANTSKRFTVTHRGDVFDVVFIPGLGVTPKELPASVRARALQVLFNEEASEW